MLEGAQNLQGLCRCVEDTLNAPVVQVGTAGASLSVGRSLLVCVRVCLRNWTALFCLMRASDIKVKVVATGVLKITSPCLGLVAFTSVHSDWSDS